MQVFAHVDDGKVRSIEEIPDGLIPGKDIYLPEFAAALVPVPADLVGTVGPGWSFDGSFSAPVQTAVDLKAYAAAKRFTIETAGITVDGSQVATDRESQAMITAAWNYVQASGDQSVAYKATSGFVTLDAKAIKAVALAVGAHVQACFTKEADVDAGIDAGTIKTTADIDAAFAAVTT